MVPGAGLEPARLAAGDFESPASTDFATRAVGLLPMARMKQKIIARAPDRPDPADAPPGALAA